MKAINDVFMLYEKSIGRKNQIALEVAAINIRKLKRKMTLFPPVDEFLNCLSLSSSAAEE